MNLASLGDIFNHIIDEINAAWWRLMELPLFLLLVFFFLTVALAWWALPKRKCSRRGRQWLLIVSLMLFAALITDYKISSIRHEIRQSQMHNLTKGHPGLFIRFNSHYNRDSLSGKLRSILGDFEIEEMPQHQAVDLLVIRRETPLAHIFLSVIDLRHPYVQIVLDREIGDKYLTSAFAKKYDCLLAINGEAGRNPRVGSGFGEWVGNYISDGVPLMLKDNDQRPFIAFDRSNHALYVRQEITDTTVSDEKYNAIFGRFDILLNGNNLHLEQGWKQPRTLMGVDSSGTRLYLMVVDGRQPGYSMGMGLSEAASVLRAFGAWNAMSCDQGGSSCMYLKRFDGLISRPSDDGNERITYTHFGIRISEQKHPAD